MNKIYVCSDIHGHYSKLEKALEMLDDTDKLYIVGDIVDKGPDPIKCIQKVMKDKRCELLLGNHDLMFLCYEKYQLDSSYGIPVDKRAVEKDWISHNEGWKTDDEFNLLKKDEKEEIISFLESCYLQRCICIDSKEFVLVHAMSPNNGQGDIPLKLNEKYKIYDWTDECVWERINYQEISNKIIITGHEPVPYRLPMEFAMDITKTKWNIYRLDNFYDLDCGLAVFGDAGNLGVLCLNDLKEYYF